jgi:hypothetical protein
MVSRGIGNNYKFYKPIGLPALECGNVAERIKHFEDPIT